MEIVVIFCGVALVLSADHAWASYRDWRVRRQAVKRGTTLTQKFLLPR